MFEKKRGKRFLASVMALVMLLSLAPVGAVVITMVSALTLKKLIVGNVTFIMLKP